jgi:hypothetical protein
MALRSTPNAFDSTSVPNAAGRNVTWSPWLTAPAMPQQSSPRARNVPATATRRAERIRSRPGPISGAMSANGAIVTSRYRATWLRA